MESLKPNSFYFDPIRQEKVKATPEERVRQGILKQMLEELGYPKALLAVEKELKELPHLSLARDLPKRRIDILVFAKGVKPLLLIECKAVPLTEILKQQVIAYNESVQAPYIALANEHEIWTGVRKDGAYVFRQGLPSYVSLNASS